MSSRNPFLDTPLTERRSGQDRRQHDVGPPGRVDRRRQADQRRPEVSEVDLSPEEWESLQRDMFGTGHGSSGSFL